MGIVLQFRAYWNMIEYQRIGNPELLKYVVRTSNRTLAFAQLPKNYNVYPFHMSLDWDVERILYLVPENREIIKITERGKNATQRKKADV